MANGLHRGEGFTNIVNFKKKSHIKNMGEFWKTLKKEDFENSKNAVLIWLFYNAGETIAQKFWRKFCKRTIQNLPIPRESIKKYLANSEKTVKENANEIEIIGERTIYRMLNEKLK